MLLKELSDIDAIVKMATFRIDDQFRSAVDEVAAAVAAERLDLLGQDFAVDGVELVALDLPVTTR